MNGHDLLPTAVFIRIDDICAEFEQGWKSGGRPSLEDVLSRNPDLDRSILLALLLQLELHYRRKFGEVPTLEEYVSRLPGAESVIAHVFSETQDGCPPTPHARFRHDPPGYKLLDELGGGGTGVVYLAHELAADRTVALKVLHSPGRYKAVERLLVEVRAMARLDHPNVVKVIAVEMNRGAPFFTMEYLPGGTLATLAKAKDGRPLLDPREAARLVLQAAEGVAHAHSNGIIHRDLKPSNILLVGPAGESQDRSLPRPVGSSVKVIDFGLAKRIDQDDGVTTLPSAMGTPAYMSPEMAAGRTLDGEAGKLADVYGLGATLYHLLTGRPPFVDDRPDDHDRHNRQLEIIRRVVNVEPTRPRALRPEIPAELEGIVVKAMEKDPAQRYPSAEAFADDLRTFLEGEKPTAPPLTRGRRVQRWLKRNRVRVALGAALVVAVGLIAALLPRPDPVEEIQRELRAGRPVTLVAETGPPKVARWPLGARPISQAPDGTFTFEGHLATLLELLPDPGIDHYRMTAELRILYHKVVIFDGQKKNEILGADAALVGVYFGHTIWNTTQGQPAHLSLAVTYNDCLTELARKTGITRAAVQVRKSCVLMNPDGLPERAPIGSAWAPIRFQAEKQPPGKWRRVRLEVSPEGVKVFWGESLQARWQLLSELSAEELTRHLTRMEELLGDGMAWEEAPTWKPRSPFGIWCRGAAVSVRNVVVEPSP